MTAVQLGGHAFSLSLGQCLAAAVATAAPAGLDAGRNS
jgi:hypothetical protein